MAKSNDGPEVSGHLELLYPSEYIKAADLHGRDVSVMIAKLTRNKLFMQGGKSDQRIVIHMVNPKTRKALSKRWAVPKTVLRQIGAALDEPDVSRWAGKTVTMYPTTCKGASGGTVDCIRVRTGTARGGAEIPDDMTAEPEPRPDFADELSDDASPATSEGQALANRIAAARSDDELNLIDIDFDTIKKHLSGSEMLLIRERIRGRREALAGVVPPEQEPPIGGA